MTLALLGKYEYVDTSFGAAMHLAHTLDEKSRFKISLSICIVIYLEPNSH